MYGQASATQGATDYVTSDNLSERKTVYRSFVPCAACGALLAARLHSHSCRMLGCLLLPARLVFSLQASAPDVEYLSQVPGVLLLEPRL